MSLVLCLLGVLALFILISARIIAARFTGRHDLARQKLLPVLLSGDPQHLEKVSGGELAVAANLTIELAEMTRGSERDILIIRATALGIPDLLLRRMRSWSAQKRLSAAEAITLFDNCSELACKALDDRNRDVRLGVAMALAQKGAAPEPLALIEKLGVGQQESSLLLVSLMADLAGKNSEAVAALLFERSLPYETKVAAMDALANLGGEYAPLLAYMARESAGEPELQPRVYRALGRTGHPAGAEAIIDGLSSVEWTVRASAAEAAGNAGLSQAVRHLGELLRDPVYFVRYRASMALLKLGPRGIAILREASSSEDPVVRTVATKMLVEGRAT
ncbi:HEAT repeat domain-containing protein [Altererythrobacter epoxidivorans]|uniref:HEAT repeat domain-containing protein n=1 Tax=Altererythrobacter epoxidivorans TaxID=361183 RepID=UPI0012ECDD7C|nr:HEAT repeat domain-containing protein [Altererythrobacter epoxidivorans]